MKEFSVTFPNILDYSTEAGRVSEDYNPGPGRYIPVSALIDRDGNVVDAWFGYSEGDMRPFKALQKAGIVLDDADSPQSKP